ncbi:MAG: hypothetical protein ACRDMJ_15475 [Solirubrobacteraceae bacterium]
MRHLRWLAVIVVLAALPAVALAQKPANGSQRHALYRAFVGLEHGQKATPERCLVFEVSTAASGWGNVFFNGAHMPHGCVKYGFNGVTIFHFTRGKWRMVTEGSSFVGSNGKCSVPHVPMKVARDFKLC